MSSLRYPSPELSDGPTHLRQWSLDDIACIAEASTDSRIPEGTTVPATYSPDAGRAFIERQWSRFDNGEGLSLAISSSVTGTAIGLIVLTLRPQNGVAGVGYWVVPSQRGQGHAPRAVRLVTQWATTRADPDLYIVQEGDTYESIAASQGITLEQLLGFNGLCVAELEASSQSLAAPLALGQVLRLSIDPATMNTVPTTTTPSPARAYVAADRSLDKSARIGQSVRNAEDAKRSA